MLLLSWSTVENSDCSIDGIIDWIENLNQTVKVSIRKTILSDSDFWFYDKESGKILNKNHSFFQISGMRKYVGDQLVLEQPVILQDEIGYLGIICKEINGVIYFLMQAKIEPGNVNKIQISPTIQATKSNFTQKHGGKKPPYLEYFEHADQYKIIVDQIQSEQSSRFYKKRNRNIIILVDDDVEVLPNHKWMTLGQIKQLMKYDNLVNMDTRTVLSCIPFYMMKKSEQVESLFHEKSLYYSILKNDSGRILPSIYQFINNYKMFDENRVELVPLDKLDLWRITDREIVCKHEYPFKVIFCDITMEGREVRHWTQPLFEATGRALFGLITCNDNGVKKFLVKGNPEVGCFDKIELGPTVQLEASHKENKEDRISALFFEKMKTPENIKYNVLLSEEGGRFYHEQNDNVIIEIAKEEVGALEKGYFWMDYGTLSLLTQFNNILNIQLRNLLSLLEI